MRSFWWKILCILLFVYVAFAGFLGEVPRLVILNETIRNLYFHVSIWFGMILLMLVSVVFSILYLSSQKSIHDYWALASAKTGIFLSILGLLTGMVWAKYTWGAFWTNDVKLNGSAVSVMIYLAYLVLRRAIDQPEKRGRLSAVYNIFAFVMMIVFIGILPRMEDSLHPGNGGNPGFGTYDLTSSMRMVFYPAVLGWILLGIWLSEIQVRIKKLKEDLWESELDS